MKSTSWKTCAISWVIPITLFLYFHSPSSEALRIADLQAQLRNDPRILVVVTFFDSNSPPSRQNYQETMDTVAAEYAEEIGLIIVATDPLPLTVNNIHSLPEIRSCAEEQYSVTADMLVLFVSNRIGITRTETTTQMVEGQEAVIEEDIMVNGLYLETVTSLALFFCDTMVTGTKYRGRNLAVLMLKHEIGHHLGLDHNDSPLSFMFERCDLSFHQWTETDLLVIHNHRRTHP